MKKQLQALCLVVLVLCLVPVCVFGQAKEKVTFLHYFSGTLAGGIDALVATFNANNPKYELTHTPADHESFKTSIQVMLSGGNPPDLFSYWAGARVQFVVDAGRLEPIDDVFEKNGLNTLFSAAVNQGCAYNGKKYFLPLTQHFVAFFYNKAVFEKAGVTPPKTWEEFLAACEKLKKAGVAPIALGSRERWPAQFWLDYPLLRTAGPEYRAKLMAGKAAYTDPEVVKAFEIWKECLDKGYFNDNPNAYDWAEAATMVGTGKAAMTLMGSWFMQLDEQIGWKAGEGYDFFPFPVINPAAPACAVGPIDGVVLAKDAKAKDAAKMVLGQLADVAPQTAFNKGSGALAPNQKVADATYNALQLRIKALLATIPNWAFNYDLATPPPVADVGLDAFSKFINAPKDYMTILKETETGAKAAFSKL